MSDLDHLTSNLPMVMTMSAFFGISWYIGVDMNIRLLLLFKRRKGLYFWSCLLSSWGVILQPIFIILGDFRRGLSFTSSVTMICITWWILVVPQSFMLYSRLHLLLRNQTQLRCVLIMIVLTTVGISLPTIVLGVLAVRNSGVVRRRRLT
jgi:uncharacterized membrane protein YwzB